MESDAHVREGFYVLSHLFYSLGFEKLGYRRVVFSEEKYVSMFLVFYVSQYVAPVLLQKLKHPKLLVGTPVRHLGYVPTNNVYEYEKYEKGRKALV